MLQLIKISDLSERIKFLMSFKPEDSAFIVSDIKTKLFLESELLSQNSYLEGACVLRANEFYKELVYSLDSKWHFMPDTYVKELLVEFCSQFEESWVKNLQNSKSFIDFFNSFLFVFFHKENLKIFEEWLEEQQKNLYWRYWFKLAFDFFQYLESKQVLNETGVKALLLYHLSSADKFSFGKSKILVDLSFSIDLYEKEIFTGLSRYKEVYVLSPQLKHKTFFKNKLDIYEKWEEELGRENLQEYPLKNSSVKSSKTIPSRKLFKLKAETQIEEVKKAVVQVCKWINQGVSPDDIVIFAPHLEDYWFILRSCLEKEGVPFKKTIYSKLIDFREIKYLLSSARVHLNLFHFEDLELFCFYQESQKDFPGFKQNYFNVPKRDLVKRLLFQNKVRSADQKTTGFDFVQWLLSFCPKKAENHLLESLLAVLQKFTLKESLTYKSWLRFLESELFSKELEIEAEKPEGVSC